MNGTIISRETFEQIGKVIADEIIKQVNEACNSGKMLNIRSCDDVISRQAVLIKIGKYQLLNKWENLIKAIEDLPSVQPTRPYGEWVSIDEEPHEDYECDKCGHIISKFCEYLKPSEEYKFCPNCGADMTRGMSDKEYYQEEDQEESEVKE